MFLILLCGAQPTLLSLMARGESQAIGRRVVNVVALLVTVPSAIVAFIPPLAFLVVRTWLGASGRLQEMTEAGIRLLVLLPPVFVQMAIFPVQYFTPGGRDQLFTST